MSMILLTKLTIILLYVVLPVSRPIWPQWPRFLHRDSPLSCCILYHQYHVLYGHNVQDSFTGTLHYLVLCCTPSIPSCMTTMTRIPTPTLFRSQIQRFRNIWMCLKRCIWDWNPHPLKFNSKLCRCWCRWPMTINVILRILTLCLHRRRENTWKLNGVKDLMIYSIL